MIAWAASQIKSHSKEASRWGAMNDSTGLITLTKSNWEFICDLYGADWF